MGAYDLGEGRARIGATQMDAQASAAASEKYDATLWFTVADNLCLVAPTITTASAGPRGPRMDTAALSYGPPPRDAIRVTVNAAERYQSIAGFGAAMTESSAVNLAKLPAAARLRVMRELFGARDGLGFSYMRVPIGSSDFAENTYTYADRQGPPSDPLRYFSIARDQHAIIPMLHEALQVNPKIGLMVTPWKPPEWMCVRDGEVRTLPRENYALYADYLVRVVDAYARLNPPIHMAALSIQNEPYFFTAAYPSIRLDAQQQIEIIRDHLGPRLAAYNAAHRRPKVELFAHDHNWDIAPEALKVVDGAGKYVDAIAYHGYGGEPNDHLKIVKPTHPNLPVYFTEVSGFYGGASTPADDLVWDAQNALIGPLRVGARACLKWNIALDGKNGPINGGVDYLRAMLKIESAEAITRNQEYFGFGVASQAVKQGAVRIGVTTSSALDCVAFENPDGSRAILAVNPTDKPLVIALESGALAAIEPKTFVAIRF